MAHVNTTLRAGSQAVGRGFPGTLGGSGCVVAMPRRSHASSSSTSRSRRGRRGGKSTTSSESQSRSRRRRGRGAGGRRALSRSRESERPRSSARPAASSAPADVAAPCGKGETGQKQAPTKPWSLADNSTRGGGDSEPPIALVRRAAALRMKYRKRGNLVRIPVMQVGAHPDNRDRLAGPSGSRCIELTGQILCVGYDAVEADSNGVLVEQKPGSTHIRDANARIADGDELLAPTLDGQICFGTLSHSSLNQLLRNIHERCLVIPDSKSVEVEGLQQSASAVAEDDPLFRIVDAAGRLSPELLEQVDPEFATAVHGGLLWEILSYTIEDEEPDGCAVIQAALNAKNGLFMVCHEMQALSRLMTLTSSSAVAERSLKWEYVLRRMRETMPQFADDPNVLDLYAFVVDMGADTSSFFARPSGLSHQVCQPKAQASAFVCFRAV